MIQCRPLHISYSAGPSDGGIAFAVSDLLAAQHDLNIFSRWMTAEPANFGHQNKRLLQAALNLQPTILHLHGLWRSPTRIAVDLSKLDLPYVIAPHGMLDPWALAHSSWKKQLAWQMWEHKALKNSACLQALCYSEVQSIKQKIQGTPIALIPNGVYLPPNISYSRDKLPWANHIPSDEKVLLFIGRYHQKKGLEPLMTAWQSIASKAKLNGWWLVFIGYGDDGKFQSQLNNCPVENVLAFGPVFGSSKHAVFQHAHAFILPSFSEGLPIAALEAMSFRLPLLLSKACNLPEAFHAHAALNAEPEVESLSKKLLQLFEMSSFELSDYGSNSYNLVKTKFSWQRVATQTIQLYSWIHGHSSRPDFVFV